MMEARRARCWPKSVSSVMMAGRIDVAGSKHTVVRICRWMTGASTWGGVDRVISTEAGETLCLNKQSTMGTHATVINLH
jgi:hypothetical protein